MCFSPKCCMFSSLFDWSWSSKFTSVSFQFSHSVMSDSLQPHELKLVRLPCPSPTPISSVQFSRSVASDSWRPHESQHTRSPCPSPTPRVYSNDRVGDAIQPSHPLSSPSPPAPSPSQHQGLFQRVNSSHEVAKVLEFQPQHQSFQWTPGLISFRMDWLDPPCNPGTLKSLLQHHGSKASRFWHSAFFMVQLPYPYMTTGKTIALTKQTFVSKVMSLIFNMLSRLATPFLLRRKSLNFMAAVTICSDFGT